MNRIDLSIIILTHNEEKHIERCIKSAFPVAKEIFVVDSFSTDKTVEIAESLGARVYTHKWENNHAKQLNWGLENCPITTQWVMRMDSDEYLTPELQDEITQKLSTLDESVCGVYMKRRVFFMGRWIKHGGYYPTWLLRIWRHKKAICEQRNMDEHIKLLEGRAINFEHDLIDDNLNDLTWWTQKHNNYATREAMDILEWRENRDGIEPRLFGAQEQKKRWLKERYLGLPLFVRPCLYFVYRYVVKFGFLDGKEGLIWHFLQGFWYRFLVDAKLYKMKKKGV